MSGLSDHCHVASSIVEYVSDGTAADLCWDKVRPLWLFSLVGRARWHTTIFATCFGTVLLRPHSDPYRSGHKSVGAVTASPDLSNPTTSSGQFTGRPLSSLVWTNLGRSPQTFSSVPTSPVGRRGVESGAGYTRGVAVRPISRVIPAVIAGAVGMVAGLGIGLVAASHGSAGTPRGPATTSIASSAQWAGEGPQLERDTGRNWAYESIPIDVKGNGTYFFNFGPVPASFDYPSSPSGIAFDWPSDSRFSIVGATAPHYVALRGKRYVQMGFSVSNFSSPYRGYKAWIY